jgi:VWFA-related protein
MAPRLRFLSPCVLLLLFCSGQTPAADKPDKTKPEQSTTAVREEARATLVEVPVNVVDKKGRPVEGLTADDFQVYDDGQKQTITGFDVVDERRSVPQPAVEEPPLNPAARRNFLILFDLTFGSPRSIFNARRAARDFVVNRMKDLDLAAVVTYSVERGMRLLVSFTGDRTQLAAAIDTLGFPTLADRNPDPLSMVITPPSQSNSTGFAYLSATSGSNPKVSDLTLQDVLENLQIQRARELRAIYRNRVNRLLDSFSKLARALDSVKGRKHILYLSEGFDSRELAGSNLEGGGSVEGEWVVSGQSYKLDSDTRFGNSGLQSSMSHALALFNRSDCVIHAIDIGGLRAASDPSGSTDQTINGQDSLFYIAKETGGEFLRNTNDLSGSFDQLLERTGLMYVLAFQPVRVPENGKFHALKVVVKNKSWRVSARSGYYEPKSEKTLTPVERKLALSSAIAAAVPNTDVPAWVLAAAVPAGADSSRVSVVVEVPGDRLIKGQTGTMMSVDLYVYAIDRQGQTQDYFYQPLTIDMKLAEANLAKNGVKYYGQLRLPPGDYTLRTLVRNNETGRFGVSITPLKVPAGTDPAALPPLFVDQGKEWIMVKAKQPRVGVDPGEYPFAIEGESFIPAAFAGMKNGEKSKVCLIAYNFPSGSGPLEYTARALGVDGKPHGRIETTLLRASDGEHEGARKLMLEFRPSGLDPGRYALSVRLRDPKTGKSSESTAPFDVQ